MSRRNKNAERDVESWIRDKMAERVKTMMTNRHMLMAPFPIPALDVYNLMWTPAQQTAFELLRGTDTLKMRENFVLIGCPGPDNRGIRRIVITLDEKMPLPHEKEFPFMSLPDGMQEQIQAWIPEWLRYQKETGDVAEKVKTVGRICSTYGQVVRLWPELQGFLGEWGADKVHKARAKSPYPDAVLEWVDDPDHRHRRIASGKLAEEFRPEAFEPFNHMIAECLMLPEIDNLSFVGRVI